MKQFIRKALSSLRKLPEDQVHRIIEELAVENDLLETLLNSLPDGLVVADSNNRILAVNLQARRLLPMPKGDLTEKEMGSVIVDPMIADRIRESLAAGETLQPVDFTLDKGGRSLILSVGLYPLVREGKIQGNLIHISDVTGKRAEEARLKRAEGLASLTTMTAGVAHEIKNPLGAISLHIQLMQKLIRREGCRDDDKKEILEYLSIVDEEVDRLNSIVVNYLFAVRPLDLVPEPVDLVTLVQDLVSFVRPELEEGHIAVHLEFPRELPRIHGDEKLLKQALLNIIKNGREAMPFGGDLTIKLDYREQQVNILVMDTGVGIPDGIKGKIFEPFYTTKDQGSGLGLTLVFKIIKEHGGDIQLATKEGKGTAFRLVFPVPQKEQRLLACKEGDCDDL